MGARARVLLSVAAAAVASLPARGRAQARPSELASVSQVVAGTRITVEYYRPVARGRDSLFGKVVPWGHTWTPGANWGTVLEVDKDVQLEGRPLPKGRYSVWMVPRRDSAWIVRVSRTERRFHTLPPDSTDDQLRLEVPAQQGPFVEVLTFSFPAVTKTGAELRMQWGTTYVPLQIAVDTKPTMLTAAEQALYVGTYKLKDRGANSPGFAETLEVSVGEDGNLRARSTGTDQRGAPVNRSITLLPSAPGVFHPARREEGVLVGPEVDIVWTFTVQGPHATSLEVRSPIGTITVRGDYVK